MSKEFELEQFMELVSQEVRRQNEKWGYQYHSPDTWVTILTEEVGKVAHDALNLNQQGFLNELVQVAAVAYQAYKTNQSEECDL